MKIVYFLVFFVLFLISSISCSPVTIESYGNAKPTLMVEEFFEGNLVAYGVVRNRSGKVTRQFEALLKGSWEDGEGKLEEVFWFTDGEKQTRTWLLTPNEMGYTGTASDVEGEANISMRGNAMRLNYRLIVPYNDSEIVLSMDDWMYQVIPGVVINETKMMKFGFRVGLVTLVIMKESVAETIPTSVATMLADPYFEK